MEMVPELMAYMGTIIRAKREYTGLEWSKYHMPEACGFKKDRVVGDKPHHLREMFYRSH